MAGGAAVPSGYPGAQVLAERRRAWRELHRILDRDPYPDLDRTYPAVRLREAAA